MIQVKKIINSILGVGEKFVKFFFIALLLCTIARLIHIIIITTPYFVPDWLDVAFTGGIFALVFQQGILETIKIKTVVIWIIVLTLMNIVVNFLEKFNIITELDEQ